MEGRRAPLPGPEGPSRPAGVENPESAAAHGRSFLAPAPGA